MKTKMVTAFDQLALNDPILSALRDVGYETPTPIQAQTIPLLLEGKDILGQAQTGTGKTAAFALPLLSNLDLKQKEIQILVLAPTRELAIQVAEAFKTYASRLKGFHVLPIYGGQDYRTQISALKRGVHVIVGTPGRVMDHMRRGTLKLHKLRAMVLDEADEMLRMGFIDDVEWILEQTPEKRQTALFSATMPRPIRHIAQNHLNSPEEVIIKVRTATADTIRQRYWPVSGFAHKLDALTRILESEIFDAVLVFVRTKTATVELAEKLEARGYAAAPLNGDIQQRQRERTVEDLKKKKLEIVVATDVAARGLDVEQISHVINFDIPHDAESYIHRIGRTGRAGRAGDAVLFVAPRERRLLHSIERATNSKIELMEQPSTKTINARRITNFNKSISETLKRKELGFYAQLIEQYRQEHDVPTLNIAAALAILAQGDAPLLLKERPGPRRENFGHSQRNKAAEFSAKHSPHERIPAREKTSLPDHQMERYRIEVGHNHDVKPGNIVGAIANEADIDSKYIGQISIYDDHSLVDLPEGMPKALFRSLKKVWVSGQQLKISRLGKKACFDKSHKSEYRKTNRVNHQKTTMSAKKTRHGHSPAR